MKGTIIERPKNSRNFCIRYSAGFDEATGRYRQIWKSGFSSITEAKKYLNELEYKQNTRTLPKASKRTLGAYLTNWLRDSAKPHLSPKGYERYESLCRVHVIPAIGDVQLAELEPKHLRNLYLQKQNSGLAPRTVRYLHVILHKALQDGLEDNVIIRNAADAVKPPKAEATDMLTWNESELKQFLETAKDTEYYALFFCVLFTGMRRSELLALRWSDLDLAFGQVSVKRGLHQLKDKSFVYSQPKSKKSVRTIALSPAAVDTIENHHTAKTIEAKMLGSELRGADLVFCHLNGKEYRPNSVSRAWKNTARRAGVKVIRMHDGRHTHASILLKQGVHPKIVQERLGHSSIQITLDTYSHVAPGLQEAAAKRFDDVLVPKYNVTVS